MLPAVPSTRVSPGLMSPRLLGGLDHRQADAVLDGAAGVLRFELEVQLAQAGVEALGLDDRRLADQFEDGRVDGHADRAVPEAADVRRAMEF